MNSIFNTTAKRLFLLGFALGFLLFALGWAADRVIRTAEENLRYDEFTTVAALDYLRGFGPSDWPRGGEAASERLAAALESGNLAPERLEELLADMPDSELDHAGTIEELSHDSIVVSVFATGGELRTPLATELVVGRGGQLIEPGELRLGEAVRVGNFASVGGPVLIISYSERHQPPYADLRARLSLPLDHPVEVKERLIEAIDSGGLAPSRLGQLLGSYRARNADYHIGSVVSARLDTIVVSVLETGEEFETKVNGDTSIGQGRSMGSRT